MKPTPPVNPASSHSPRLQVLAAEPGRPYLKLFGAAALLLFGAALGALGLLALDLARQPFPRHPELHGDLPPTDLNLSDLIDVELGSPAIPVAVPAGPAQGQGPRVEVTFVMDTTGSMGGLIRAAKKKAWSIVNELADAQPRPSLALGLVAYRDEGDRYVTHTVPLTSDLEAFYQELDALKARGGGDTPEAVSQGLAEALAAMSTEPNHFISPHHRPPEPAKARLVFLMGDAPAHDTARAKELVQEMQGAHGIRVNAIQLGESQLTQVVWQQLAELGTGQYLRIPLHAPTQTVTTPFDEQIVQLQGQIEDTVVPYGSVGNRQKLRREWSLANTLGLQSRASRASANSKLGTYYQHDLLHDLETGQLANLEAVEGEALPQEYQELSPAQRKQKVEQLLGDRRTAQAQLKALVVSRDEFIRTQGRPRDSFDAQLLDVLKQQLKDAGFCFEPPAPKQGC